MFQLDLGENIILLLLYNIHKTIHFQFSNKIINDYITYIFVIHLVHNHKYTISTYSYVRYTNNNIINNIVN